MLRDLYQKIYMEGKDSFFTFDTKDITDMIINSCDFSGKKGCRSWLWYRIYCF